MIKPKDSRIEGFTSIEHRDRTYVLRKMLGLCITRNEDKLYVGINRYLGIRIWPKKSLKRLRERFHEEFDWIYRHIAMENDDSLGPNAIKIKKRMLRLIKQIKTKGRKKLQ
jgi:hypothetical protein